MLDLDPYGGTDPLCVSSFLKRTVDVMVHPSYSVMSQRLVRPGSFPACSSQVNITSISKCLPSSSVGNYQLISITSVLSKVFECSVSVHIGRFVECSGALSTTQFAYRKWLGTCDALLYMSHTLQSALESGKEAGIVQIDYIAAFDKVNHQGILYKLCSLGIGGSMLFMWTESLSNRSQHIVVDGCRRKLVNVVSGVPQDSVLGS